jgi:hypothetical protein
MDTVQPGDATASMVARSVAPGIRLVVSEAVRDEELVLEGLKGGELWSDLPIYPYSAFIERSPLAGDWVVPVR